MVEFIETLYIEPRLFVGPRSKFYDFRILIEASESALVHPTEFTVLNDLLYRLKSIRSEAQDPSFLVSLSDRLSVVRFAIVHLFQVSYCTTYTWSWTQIAAA